LLIFTDFNLVKEVSAVRNFFNELEIREKAEQEMNRYAQMLYKV